MLSPDKNLQSAGKRSQEAQPLPFQNHLCKACRSLPVSLSDPEAEPGSRPLTQARGGGSEGPSGCQGAAQPGPLHPAHGALPTEASSCGDLGRAESLAAAPPRPQQRRLHPEGSGVSGLLQRAGAGRLHGFPRFLCFL